MPGFNFSLGQLSFPAKQNLGNLESGSIKGRDYVINKFTIPKFNKDKVFINLKDFIIVLEGVILNKTELLKANENWTEKIIDLYHCHGDSFFNVFRGSFSGLLYDKKKDKWIIFTDHIGSKHVYYSFIGGNLVISSEIQDIYYLFKTNSLNFNLDVQAAYMLLSYGFMLEDFTLCEQIQKLKPGRYLVFQKGLLKKEVYHQIPEENNKVLNEKDGIDQIDFLFRKSIQLQFEKDIEYGYKHLVGLSGGLDSRMTTWVAHEMGFTDQLNMTFSQSGYLDETIAKEIAADLKHEWIFKALDNGVFLKNIEEITGVTGGNVLYYTLAHGNSMLSLLNFDGFGILHTGQVGGIIKGYYAKKVQVTGGGAYSTKLLNKINLNIKEKYAFEREFQLYNRQFNGTLFGDVNTQRKTETLSPYLSVDLINLGLNHTLFKKRDDIMIKWILNKYPKAGEYIWEAKGAKLTDRNVNIFGRKIPARQVHHKIINRLLKSSTGINSKNHMNPLGFWYKNNPDIKSFQDDYFSKNISRLDRHLELKKDCRELYENGSGTEKNQVLSLLSAMKHFFN